MKEAVSISAKQSGIAATGYVASRLASSSTDEEDAFQKTQGEKQIAQLTDASLRRASKRRQNNKTAPPKATKKGRTSSVAVVPAYPPPSNGKQYLKMDAVDLLLQQTSRSIRRNWIDEWIEKEFIPVQRHSMTNIVSKASKGIPISESWGATGRPPLMTVSQVKASITKIHSEQGNTFTRDDINTALRATYESNSRARGIITPDKNIPRSTTSRYHMLAAAVDPKASIQTSTTKKPETRYIAENSWISGVCFLLVVAYTHFVIGRDPFFEANVVPMLPPGSKKIIKMIEGVERVHVHPIKPRFIFSMDDTTQYIFEGTGGSTKKDEMVLVSQALMR